MVSHGKIITPEQFKSHVYPKKISGVTGLCHGVFDVLHSGHIEHLEEAKSKVDCLIVSVTHDEYVDKGPGRPINSHFDRMKVLAAIEAVDYVVLSKSSSAVINIELIRPNFYFKGQDYQLVGLPQDSEFNQNLKFEIDAVRSFGGEVFFTQSPLRSSSEIINKTQISDQNLMEVFQGARDYLKNNPLELLESELKSVRFGVVGEIIHDEFVFTESLGRSGKHPIVAHRELSRMSFLGGVVPVFYSLVHFVGNSQVFLVSAENSSALDTDLQSLGTDLILSESVKPIIKRRFIDRKTGTFVFEQYEMDDSLFSTELNELFEYKLSMILSEVDLALVLDYGHGLISETSRSILNQNASKVALNVQRNAGNRGLHHVGKYTRASVIVLNGEEVEIELRSKGLELGSAALQLHKKFEAEIVVITDGSNGLFITDGSRVLRVPSLHEGVIVDRTGSGDSVFLAVAGFSAVTRNLELLGLVGNIAGSVNLKYLANQNILNFASLFRSLKYLLK